SPHVENAGYRLPALPRRVRSRAGDGGRHRQVHDRHRGHGWAHRREGTLLAGVFSTTMLKNSYNRLVDSRRETILAFLKIRGHASLGEVAAHLEISKQGALRHMETLEADGLATVAPAEEHRRGRPENVYKLTPAAHAHFPNAHRQLAGGLIEFLSKEQLKPFFERRAARLEAEYAPRLAGLDFDGRVRELA